MTIMHVLLTVTLLVTSLVTAAGIQCYNCESISEPNCGDDFNMAEYFKIDCDQVAPPRYIVNELDYLNATACVKRVYKEHNILKYVRSCYFGDVNDTEIGCRMDPSLMDIQDVQCYVCDNDNFCNTAPTTSILTEHHLIKYLTLLLFMLMAKIFN